MPEMEDSYTPTEYSEDFRGTPDIACRRHTSKHCGMDQV